MALSWNEIKDRALKFSKEWADETNEDAEAKSFLDAFFHVFDVSRKRMASFETRVKKLDNRDGYIDMLWKGVILIEMKSRGKDLDKAYKQATDYFPGLKEYDLPRYILVCDFERFRLYDLEEDRREDFSIKDFYKHVKSFGFIAGYQTRTYQSQDPVNIEAAERMGKLHDQLKNIGYKGHELEIYLVRLLFCLFAEDTSIFEKRQFQDYIEEKTKPDGSDLASHLSTLFYVLNKPREHRLTNLDEHLNAFPYVNGKLFEENLSPASFDTEMRNILLECCALDWGKISPAIFGSMFQSVMNPVERRNLGAHYTSEKNILKLIKPLFLDDLIIEFEKIKLDKRQLVSFHKKLASLTFLDPACGCGNFLIITYRELRLLEIKVIKSLQQGQQVTNVNSLINVEVSQFYGIEYEEFPARIAEVALWLIDHQMNMLVSEEFGEYYVRLPLRKFSHIVHGNALRIDWEGIIPSKNLSYILGNPPFGGKHKQSKEQKTDISLLMSRFNNCSDLDYVAGWFYKASKYIVGSKIEVAFVSTNSIVQGEQVELLWPILLKEYSLKINFAHQTFKWKNEAKGVAAVHCIIIGFSNFDRASKWIFEYENVSSEAHELKVSRINTYLNSGPVTIVQKRKQSICNAPSIKYGNKPTDDGNYLFNDDEKADFLKIEPAATKYFRKYIGSAEFINGISRWCLWLKDATPGELKTMPLVLERIDRVRKFRESSSAEPTRKAAKFPSLFFYTSQPNSNYLVIPETSSERRRFIPIGYMNADVIASNAVYLIPSADLFTFGLMCSTMHMAWTRTVCGRLKSDYRYSGSIVYNNFPLPQNYSAKQILAIELAAQKILDIRKYFPDSTLADLYDPLVMPSELVKAHQNLDKAVDLCYRPQPFPNETKRMEFLFEMYENYTAGMFAKEKNSKSKKAFSQ